MDPISLQMERSSSTTKIFGFTVILLLCRGGPRSASAQQQAMTAHNPELEIAGSHRLMLRASLDVSRCRAHASRALALRGPPLQFRSVSLEYIPNLYLPRFLQLHRRRALPPLPG